MEVRLITSWLLYQCDVSGCFSAGVYCTCSVFPILFNHNFLLFQRIILCDLLAVTFYLWQILCRRSCPVHHHLGILILRFRSLLRSKIWESRRGQFHMQSPSVLNRTYFISHTGRLPVGKLNWMWFCYCWWGWEFWCGFPEEMFVFWIKLRAYLHKHYTLFEVNWLKYQDYFLCLPITRNYIPLAHVIESTITWF